MSLPGGQMLRVYLPLIFSFYHKETVSTEKATIFADIHCRACEHVLLRQVPNPHLTCNSSRGLGKLSPARSMHSFTGERREGFIWFYSTEKQQPSLILIAELSRSSKTGWKSSSGLGKRSMHSFQRGRGRGACGELNEILALPIWGGGPPIKLKAI